MSANIQKQIEFSDDIVFAPARQSRKKTLEDSQSNSACSRASATYKSDNSNQCGTCST